MEKWSKADTKKGGGRAEQGRGSTRERRGMREVMRDEKKS